MGCKQSTVRRTQVGNDGNTNAALVLDQIGKDSLVTDWLRQVDGLNGSGDIVVDESDRESDEEFVLAEEFIVGEPCNPEAKTKLPYLVNPIQTTCPFTIEVDEDFYCPSMALEEDSAGKSTFFFNHLPEEVIAKNELPYEKAPKDELNKSLKDPRKRDLKKRKAKQQRREADQIRRKRKKGAVGAFADDDTLADLASNLQMPEINYSVVLISN